MLISLHKQATTTPKIRAAIQASTEPAWKVAERYGISEQTVWKWRNRDSVEDRSHTAHRLQSTLTPAQEAVAVSLRKTLLLPLDDLLSVVREFLNPNVSRSGLDRCLRRHGVGNLRALRPVASRPAHKPFRAYEPGYLHVDVKYLPQMADEDRRRYLFVAIDRATRWVFVRIYPAKTAANARRFLRDLERAAPMRITRVLTDNGKEFTDRLFGLRKRAATGNHDFDRLCDALGIEHRLAPPMHPQTNGMVERFNGRIEDVLQSHRFRSGEDLEQTILRYVRLYNGQLPQSVLKGQTPIDRLKDWRRQRPELFKKRPYNHTGCDTYEGETSDRELVSRADDDGVAILTLNDPRSINALSEGMLAALSDALDEIGQDRSVKAVILRTAGSHFCAGHNLKEMSARRSDPDGGFQYFQDLFATCSAMMLRVVRLPQPVIAEVKGIATAAGCQLVASCDLAVASEDARFATSGVNIGLFCSTPMVALSRNVPRKVAMEMLLLGEFVPADRALAIGLVNRVVPRDALGDASMEMARIVADKSPAAIKIGKRAFYEQAEMPLEEAYAHTGRVMAENMMARDAEAGIGAFTRKEPMPDWTGE